MAYHDLSPTSPSGLFDFLSGVARQSMGSGRYHESIVIDEVKDIISGWVMGELC